VTLVVLLIWFYMNYDRLSYHLYCRSLDSVPTMKYMKCFHK